MAGRAAEIHVENLDNVARGFRELEKLSTLSKELKTIAEKVSSDARAKVPSKSGDAADSIRARASAGSASVVGGVGKDAGPYYKWLDFGSRTPNSGQPRSVGPWTRSGAGPKGGRFLYPAIDDNRRYIVDHVGNAVDDAIRKAGLR